jgi:hypothetical protein
MCIYVYIYIRCIWSSVERLGTLPTTQPTDHAAALYRLALV